MTVYRSDRVHSETIISPGHLIRRTFAYPSSPETPGGTAATTRATPRPPDWPFVLAREDDDLAVGVAARQNGPRLALEATVLDGEGHGTNGLRLAFRLQTGSSTSTTQAKPCGAGCYQAAPVLDGKPRLLTVQLERLGR